MICRELDLDKKTENQRILVIIILGKKGSGVRRGELAWCGWNKESDGSWCEMLS